MLYCANPPKGLIPFIVYESVHKEDDAYAMEKVRKNKIE